MAGQAVTLTIPRQPAGAVIAIVHGRLVQHGRRCGFTPASKQGRREALSGGGRGAGKRDPAGLESGQRRRVVEPATGEPS